MSQNLNNFTLNRFLNPNSQFSVGNWVAFADAAATSPADGTGGSPTSTITRTESTPLDGNASLLFTAGVNKQGEGASADIVLQASDATKVFTLSLDYQISTGAYTEGTQSTQSNLTLWFYDVTNSVMYQMTPSNINGMVSATAQYQMQSQIQIPVGCLTGRLIIYIPTATNSAFTVKLNNISFGRVARIPGAVITNGATWAPVVQGAGTVTLTNFFYNKTGPFFNAQGTLVTGTCGASVAMLMLPVGIVPDSAFYGTSYNYQIGQWTEGSSAGLCGPVLLSGATLTSGGSNILFFNKTPQNPANALSAANANAIWNNAKSIAMFFSLKVTGQEGQGTLGQDADTRVCAALYTFGATVTVPNAAIVNFNSQLLDTHGAVTTGASWNFVAPIAGIYQVNLAVAQGSSSVTIDLYKNDVATWRMISAVSTVGAFSPGNPVALSLVAGDRIDLRQSSGASAFYSNLSPTRNFINIYRLSGPAQVQAAEVITARYSSNAGQSITNNTVTVVNYEDLSYDDHSAVTTGSGWVFTCPRAGKVRVNAKAQLASNNGWGVGEIAYLSVFKNGVEYGRGEFDSPVTATIVVNVAVDDEVMVIAGDTIDIRIYQNSGGTIAMTATNVLNYVSINYVGGTY